jgi:KOW motif
MLDSGFESWWGYMAKEAKVGSLVLILAGHNEGDTGIVERIDKRGKVQGTITRGKDVGKSFVVYKGLYKVIT